MLCNLTNKFNQSWNSCSVAIDASKPSAIEVKNYFNKETTNDGLNATHYPNPRLSIWSNYFLLLKRGHVEVVLCIKAGNNTPNCQTLRKRWTPIQLAAKDGCSEVVKILAGCMDRPNAPGNLRLTPIQVATRFKRGKSKGHTEAVKVLVGCTNTPNKALDMQGRTPIHYAMANGQHDVVKLLAPFVDTFASKNQWTPMQTAASRGQVENVKILANHMASPNAPGLTGWTPLQLAVKAEHIEVVKVLAACKDASDYFNNCGWTPFQIAASYHGNVEIIKILLQCCSDNPNDPGFTGGEVKTAVQLAAEKGYSEVVKVLAPFIDDLNETGEHPWTPMQIAASGGHMKFVEVLSNFMPNPNAPGNNGWTPLALAAMNGHVDIAKFMAIFTKTPNAKGLIDWTPMQLAAKHGKLEVVKLLVELTDDPNSSDNFVTTPIEIAKNNGHIDIANFLEEFNNNNAKEVPLPIKRQKGISSCKKRKLTPAFKTISGTPIRKRAKLILSQTDIMEILQLTNGMKEETEKPMEEEISIPRKRRRLSSSNIADTLEPMFSR